MVLKHMLHLRDIWKEAKLQDTQTGRVSYPTVLKPDKVLSERQVWKSVRLQGSQIFCEWRNGVHAIWKGIELQGTQTRAATDPLVLEKKKLYGTQIRYGKQL